MTEKRQKNRSKSSVTAQQRPLSQMTNEEDSSSINSITSSNENVNTPKYYIQESENNSGSFSFDKNAKRYEDLQEANTVNSINK